LKQLNPISEFSKLFYVDKENKLVTVFWNSLYIAFFLLPIGINLPTPFFVFAISLGIINIFRSSSTFDRRNWELLLFPLYFIVIGISLIYTDNNADGLRLLQRSLSLLLFPLVFLFLKEDATSVRKLFEFLLYGLVVSFFFNSFWAGYVFFKGLKKDFYIAQVSSQEMITHVLDLFKKQWDVFIESEFTTWVNPNYISLYILLVLSYYLKKTMQSRIQLAVVVILFLYLFLLASPAAYFVLLIMSIMLVTNIKDNSKRYVTYITLMLGAIIFLNNPRISDFYDGVEDIKINGINDNKEVSVERSRLLTWNASIQLIQEAPFFGYGIGDANTVLINRYKKLNYYDNYYNKYNAHNQFLQTYLQTGIIGFVILVAIFGLLAIRMKRSRNEFSVFLVLFIAVFFESMLVRFNGIVFYSIIIPLLLKKRSILSSKIIRNYPTS